MVCWSNRPPPPPIVDQAGFNSILSQKLPKNHMDNTYKVTQQLGEKAGMKMVLNGVIGVVDVGKIQLLIIHLKVVAIKDLFMVAL